MQNKFANSSREWNVANTLACLLDLDFIRRYFMKVILKVRIIDRQNVINKAIRKIELRSKVLSCRWEQSLNDHFVWLWIYKYANKKWIEIVTNGNAIDMFEIVPIDYHDNSLYRNFQHIDDIAFNIHLSESELSILSPYGKIYWKEKETHILTFKTSDLL